MKIIEIIDATSGMPVYSESGLFKGQQLNAAQMTLSSNLSESLLYISADPISPPPSSCPAPPLLPFCPSPSPSLAPPSPSPTGLGGLPAPSPSPPPPSPSPRHRAASAVVSTAYHNAFAISDEGETPEELRAQLSLALDLARMRGGPRFGPQCKSLRAIERLVLTAQHLGATRQSDLLMCLEHLEVPARLRLGSAKQLRAAAVESRANAEARFAMVCAGSRIVAEWSATQTSLVPPPEQYLLAVHAHSLFEFAKIPVKFHGRDPFASMSSAPPPAPVPKTLAESLESVPKPAASASVGASAATNSTGSRLAQTAAIETSAASDSSQVQSNVTGTASSEHVIPAMPVALPESNHLGSPIPSVTAAEEPSVPASPPTDTTPKEASNAQAQADTVSRGSVDQTKPEGEDSVGGEDGEESMVVLVEEEGVSGSTTPSIGIGIPDDDTHRSDTPSLSVTPPAAIDSFPRSTTPPPLSPGYPKSLESSPQRASLPNVLHAPKSVSPGSPLLRSVPSPNYQTPATPILPSTPSIPSSPTATPRSGTPLRYSSVRPTPQRTAVRGEYTLLHLTPSGYVNTLSNSQGAVDPISHILPHWVYTVQLFPSVYLIVVMRGGEKQPEQLKSMVAKLRKKLTDFSDFFLATHLPVLRYISAFPGLVHFMFAERVHGVCVTPPITSLYGRQYKHESAADDQVIQQIHRALWAHVHRTRRFLTAGYPCSILRTQEYQCSYRLWLDDDGIEVPWDTPWVLVMQKRWLDSKSCDMNNPERGSSSTSTANKNIEEQAFTEGPRPVTPQWYVELIEAISSHYGRRPQRCYELYSLYIPCLPASVVARNDKALAASLIAHISG
ncbi:Hermansky-Pudlak syndrome 1 protein [Pelomyxa schiedti]|nr:Hermansky-Pudlak syndrome 1 protein [Pelomyxa schiedti]